MMSFDDDADVPMNDLMKQGCVPHQTVISLISGVKRMAPGGALADKFTARGYPVDNHPPWFGTPHCFTRSSVGISASVSKVISTPYRSNLRSSSLMPVPACLGILLELRAYSM